jgi:Ca2+/Na+ antiporter
MLSRDLSFFSQQILIESLQSMWALLALVLLVMVVFVSRILGNEAQRWHTTARAFLTCAALALLIFNFYNTTVEIPESLELLEIAKEHPDDADCGTAQTGFIPAGVGLLNPCKAGCYRGITLRRTMRVRGLVPRPEYSREFQCWVRRSPDKDLIPEKYRDLVQ